MQTKTKVKIIKQPGVSISRKMTCAEDGTVLRSEPMDMTDATQLIKSLNLKQESKTEKDGTTTYTYA